jgi:hypothetical protein
MKDEKFKKKIIKLTKKNCIKKRSSRCYNMRKKERIKTLSTDNSNITPTFSVKTSF